MVKRYKNISTVEQLDIAPGQTGEADIPEAQEFRMVARGAIEVVEPAPEPEEVVVEEVVPDKPPEETKTTPETTRPGTQKGR